MVKPEYTGERDLTYSRWHRTLRRDLYVSDIDYIEYKPPGIPVAVVETKKVGTRLEDIQRYLYITIGDGLKIPSFFVQYNADCTYFIVEPINYLATKYIAKPGRLTAAAWSTILEEVHDADRCKST
jgi:hypothetical protein